MTVPDQHVAPHTPPPSTLITIAALGVVFGDIGTSPLYALRESFLASDRLAVSVNNVFGVLSLIFWSLVLVVGVKYVVVVMRADNDGEGGILALTAMITPEHAPAVGRTRVLLALGLFGTALLYGDGIITPAISVLSAVEGFGVATPTLDPYVIPVAIAILIGLFAIQQRGTASIGGVFGPIMIVWFSVLALLGIYQVVEYPSILKALNPLYGVRMFSSHPTGSLLALGAIFLVVTGSEALYADMGHFGHVPIRRAWWAVVFPALTVNYFGQGALIVSNPAANRESVLLDVAVVGTHPAGHPGDARHRHRLSGADFRRVFAHTAGSATRVPAPSPDPTHVGAGVRSDLHPPGQLAVDGQLPHPGAHVQDLICSRSGIRSRRHHDDGDHDTAAHAPGSRPVGLVPIADLVRQRSFSDHRPGLLLGQHPQTAVRWVAPPRNRCRRLRAHLGVAVGP